MIKIISENPKEIKKNQKNLEKNLSVKIEIKGNDITFEGTAENEYIAEKVFDAIDFGFSIHKVLKIKKEDASFEILDVKGYTKKKDMKRIVGRIIGTQGKTIKTLSDLTKCSFEVKDNRVGIIGTPELIQNAENAIIFIIQGSKQSNVYAFLEKHQIKPVLDLGLKEEKKSKE
jgi:ribosomal RNA assembly protein